MSSRGNRKDMPPESMPPYFFYEKKETTKADQDSLLNKSGKRQDGRLPNELRPMFLRAGVISQAKGSAYIELENTKVICGVHGPREISRREEFSIKGKLKCEFSFAPFSCQTRRAFDQQDNEAKDLSLILQQALEPAVCLDMFPKSQVDVHVVVLENDGSALSAAITCASLALAHAGVEMYDMVTGCSLRLAGHTLLHDPTVAEEYRAGGDGRGAGHGAMTVGLLGGIGQLSATLQTGELQCHQLVEGLKYCISGCQQTYPVLRLATIKVIQQKTDRPTAEEDTPTGQPMEVQS